MAVLDFTMGQVLKLAKKVIRKENKCIIEKPGQSNKRNLGKFYGSMVVHLTNKVQSNKFVEKRLFEVRDESAYTDVLHEINPFKKYCFNC